MNSLSTHDCRRCSIGIGNGRAARRLERVTYSFLVGSRTALAAAALGFAATTLCMAQEQNACFANEPQAGACAPGENLLSTIMGQPLRLVPVQHGSWRSSVPPPSLAQPFVAFHQGSLQLDSLLLVQHCFTSRRIPLI
jgi:hypothetical protein